MSGAPVLGAQDAEDLQILSARLQDAIAHVKDLVWLPNSRRFAGLFNRFKWEEAESGGNNARVRAGLSIDHVLSAKMHNIRIGEPEAVLSLLAMRFIENGPEDPGGTIELVFSGGGAIRLLVECIEAQLADLTGEWAARGRPSHSLEA